MGMEKSSGLNFAAGGSGGGGIVYTETPFEGNTGATLDVSPLNLSNAVAIERNGQKIYRSSNGVTKDYTISGSVITFTIPLVATDRIVVISSNIAPIDLSSYQLKSNLSQSYSETSASKYPSSYALKEGLATKQGTLTTQTSYTSKGTSTKVPQITTNTLGQVTGITEVDISFPVVAPTVLTDQSSTSMALAGNTIYKWTSALTSLSFASVEVSDLETVLYFTTGGTITWQDNSNLKWGGDGTAPSLEINTKYCISIRNGLAEIDTYGTVS